MAITAEAAVINFIFTRAAFHLVQVLSRASHVFPAPQCSQQHPTEDLVISSGLA